MSKKENPTPMEEQETPVTGETAEADETPVETAEETAPETFTLTREQMEKMEGLAGQLVTLNDQHLRLAAEYDNYRKRTAKEKETIYQDAKMDTIAKFLDVYDNLERAVSQSGDEDNAHKKGMEMIFAQLQNVLEKMASPSRIPRARSLTPSSTTPSCTSTTRTWAKTWWPKSSRPASRPATRSSVMRW